MSKKGGPMKLFCISILILLVSCTEKKSVNKQTEPQKKVVEEVETVIKKVKEEFHVEKLTAQEKLQILLDAKEKDHQGKAFKEVIHFLDPGDTFAYMNFEEDKTQFVSDYQKILDFLTTESGKTIDDFDELSALIHIITSLGLWEPDAVGLSHSRISKDLIRNKFCIHLKNSGTDNYFWKCYGKPKKFDILNLLPEKTLFSTGFRVDKQAIIDMMSFIYLQMPRFNSTQEELQDFKKSATALKALDEYMDDEAGIAVYQGNGTITVDKMEVPSITGCLYFKIKEGATLEKIAQNSQIKNLVQAVRKFDKIKVEIKNGYLFFFMNEESEKIFDDSRVSLTEGAQFKRIKDHLPQKYNSYSYLNPDVTDKIYDFAINEFNRSMPGLEFIKVFFPKEKFMYSFFNVMEMKDNGIYMTGISDGGSTAFLFIQGVMFTVNTILFFPEVEFSDMALDTVEKGKSLNTAEILKSLDVDKLLKEAAAKKPPAPKAFSTKDTAKDLEFIRFALFEYTKINNGYFPEADGADGLSALVKRRLLKKAEYVLSDMDDKRDLPKDQSFQEHETSYVYLGGKVRGAESGSFYPLVLTKPGVLREGFMVIFANKEIKYFKTGGKSLFSMLAALNQKYSYNERQKDILRKKFQQRE
jgi:hypothetical protein